MDRTARGGGVCIYVKSGFSAVTLHAVSIPKCFEFIALKVQLRPTSVIVVGIYRPPSAIPDSIDKIGTLLSQYSESEMIVLGDLNLNWLNLMAKIALHIYIQIHTTRPL